jgi:hypothetical protein
MNRKQRRALARKNKSNTEIADKMVLFGKTPDHCLTCLSPFDKTDKEMVKNWYVVVREEEGKVNLYCPKCWEAAINMVADIEKELENESE